MHVRRVWRILGGGRFRKNCESRGPRQGTLVTYYELNERTHHRSLQHLLRGLARPSSLPTRTTRLEIPPAFDALLAAFRARFGPMPAKPGALRPRPVVERSTPLAIPGRPEPTGGA